MNHVRKGVRIVIVCAASLSTGASALALQSSIYETTETDSTPSRKESLIGGTWLGALISAHGSMQRAIYEDGGRWVQARFGTGSFRVVNDTPELQGTIYLPGNSYRLRSEFSIERYGNSQPRIGRRVNMNGIDRILEFGPVNMNSPTEPVVGLPLYRDWWVSEWVPESGVAFSAFGIDYTLNLRALMTSSGTVNQSASGSYLSGPNPWTTHGVHLSGRVDENVRWYASGTANYGSLMSTSFSSNGVLFDHSVTADMNPQPMELDGYVYYRLSPNRDAVSVPTYRTGDGAIIDRPYLDLSSGGAWNGYLVRREGWYFPHQQVYITPSYWANHYSPWW